MRKLSLFNFMTLDGRIAGPGGDIGFHAHDDEGAAFAAERTRDESTLVFGRVTYEQMQSYWPTPAAKESDPVTARAMNRAAKLVFSHTMKKASWENTTVVTGDAVAAMRELKKGRGAELTILGSGSLATAFVRAGLVDEIALMIDPIAIGEGTSIFSGLGRATPLKLLATRTFPSGRLVVTYAPA